MFSDYLLWPGLVESEQPEPEQSPSVGLPPLPKPLLLLPPSVEVGGGGGLPPPGGFPLSLLSLLVVFTAAVEFMALQAVSERG